MFWKFGIALVSIAVFCGVKAGTDERKCGKQEAGRQPRIVNGQQAALGEFPWTVAVGWKYTNDHQTGTIISDRWVLMAAHSVASPTWTSPPESMNITAGTVDLSKPGGRQYFISRVVPHPRYVEGSKTNPNYDMTLIQTTEPIQLSSNVKAVSLPEIGDIFSGLMGQISGFGLNEYNNGDTLRKLSCSIYNEKNAAQFSCKSTVNTGLAGGDSGSPLVIKNKSGKFIQVGVSTTSYRPNNSNGYAYGPLISRAENLNWIKSIVS